MTDQRDERPTSPAMVRRASASPLLGNVRQGGYRNMRFSQVVCFLLMVFPCLVLGADEGGPAWWRDCKQDDFIVRGELTYGDQPYITSTWTNDGKTLTAYYIKAKLKIAEVLY